MIGNIFSIEEFSVYDGPGIRTTVFLKGCPLRCSWCHNPEGQRSESEIVRSPNGCIGCGNCERTSVEIDGRYVMTDESIKSCPMNLIRNCGNKMTSEELCLKLLKNERILNNEGGVTFSGGEPFLQSNFMFECLSNLKGRLHTAIQTCGYCDTETFKKALDLSDYFLLDLKLIDEEKHKKYTGVSNKRILQNFSALVKSGVDFVVRIPLIPGVTDTTENLTDIAMLLKNNNVRYTELLPYNKMAGGKYKMLMREYTPDFDESVEPLARENIFNNIGIKTKIM